MGKDFWFGFNTGQSKPRTISTAAELDALPKRTVVIGDSGWAWEKRLDNYWYGEGGYVARTSSAIATNYGPFTLLVPASESAPEPVRLTDPDDPRWKDGALVRGEFKDGSAIEGYLETDKRLRFIRYGDIDPGTWYVNLDNEVPKVYLLAEAPAAEDPRVEVLAEALHDHGGCEDEWPKCSPSTLGNYRDAARSLLPVLDAVKVER